MQIKIQVFIALLTIFVSICFPRLGNALFVRIERAFRVLSLRPIGICLAFIIGSLSGMLGCLLCGIPSPAVHDEFSYLLAADTFAHGRLTNPTHPMWVFFETFHVLQHPTYMSKFPPGPGMAMALGQILVGLPIVGVWLCTGLACSALFWMLRAWLPARWALIGALLAAAHPLVLIWSHGYWGGTIAMAGGCLLIGGFRRLAGRRATYVAEAKDAAMAGIGIALCLISRPFEGGILTIVLAVCLIAMRRVPKSYRISLSMSSIVASGVPILLTLICLALYNRTLTGNPLQLPYQVYEHTYSQTPLFVFQRPQPVPLYNHTIMERFYQGFVQHFYLRMHTPGGFLKVKGARTLAVCLTYGGSPLWMIPFIFVVPLARRDPWTRCALLILCGFIVINEPSVWMQPHYLAPAAGLYFLLLVQGIRQLRVLRQSGRPMGRTAARWLTVFMVIFGVYRFAIEEKASVNPKLGWNWPIERTRIEARLHTSVGKHLIIVRYSSRHDPNREWVYNSADIDHTPVVWARDMGSEKNQKLIQYFHERTVWLLNPDVTPIVLEPYKISNPDSLEPH